MCNKISIMLFETSYLHLVDVKKTKKTPLTYIINKNILLTYILLSTLIEIESEFKITCNAQNVIFLMCTNKCCCCRMCNCVQ